MYAIFMWQLLIIFIFIVIILKTKHRCNLIPEVSLNIYLVDIALFANNEKGLFLLLGTGVGYNTRGSQRKMNSGISKTGMQLTDSKQLFHLNADIYQYKQITVKLADFVNLLKLLHQPVRVNSKSNLVLQSPKPQQCFRVRFPQ